MARFKQVIVPESDFDKKKGTFSYRNNQCERLGCPNPTVFYPSPRRDSDALICQLCNMAEREWDRLYRIGTSKIKDGELDGRVPSVSQKDSTNGKNPP